MIYNSWTWDPVKSLANKRKHGLTFETAALVFADPLHQTFADSSEDEARWQTFGLIQGMLIVVVHTDLVMHDRILVAPGRIISARKATRRERLAIESGSYGE